MPALEKPQMAYLFKVVPVSLSPGYTNSITLNVESVTLDLANKTIKARIRCSRACKTFRAIFLMVSSGKIPEFRLCDEFGFFENVLVFDRDDKSSVRHEMTMSYVDKGNLIHEIEWDFNDIRMDEYCEPEIQEIPAEPINDPDWPTPMEYFEKKTV